MAKKVERAITRESFMSTMEIIKHITDEIRELKPKAEAILKSMSEREFMSKVCNHTIGVNDNDAEVSFECAYHNKKYFDAVNREYRERYYLDSMTGKIERKKIDKPGVNVWFKGRAKFIVDCPFAGSDICKLRYFTFQRDEVPESDRKLRKRLK